MHGWRVLLRRVVVLVNQWEHGFAHVFTHGFAMSLIELFLLSCALAVDAFSVALVVGLCHDRPRQIARLAFHFGLFQALFPVLGALLSGFAIAYIRAWDHWIVFAVFGVIGFNMIVQARRGESHERPDVDLTRGSRLVGLSTAVSVDAFAAGLILSATQTPIAPAVVMIGVVTAVATVLAMLFTRMLPKRVGVHAQLIGGVVLILLGAKTLATHLVEG